MGESSKAVFLSYAHEDLDVARRIADALRDAGVEVWFDENELGGGDVWDAKIRRQIKECALFVPVISANTQARLEGYFRIEWKLAAQRTHAMAEEKAFLLPVVIDETSETEAKVPAEFKDVQWTGIAAGDSLSAFCERANALLNGNIVAAVADRGPASARSATTAAVASLPKRAAQPILDFAKAKSIAVLAFANLSHDPENEYFSDGISEELLNVLAKVPGLRVTARTSSFYFKGRNLPVPEIAQKLGVGYIVEGSVRRAGSRVRITAQLIDAVEDAHLWSETFDRELKDIFAVQDEIAGLIAENLQLKLGTNRRAAQPVDPEAYRLCLEGRRGLHFMSQESVSHAEQAFEQALQIAPDFAPARVGLAQVDNVRTLLATTASVRFCARELTQAEERAREAVHVDPLNGDAHTLVAFAAFTWGRLGEAARSYQRAVELGATAEALGSAVYGIFWLRMGRPDREAIEMGRVAKLDPFSWLPLDLQGHGLLHAGHLVEAIEKFARAEQLGAAPITYAHHAIALGRLGQLDQAVAKAREAVHPAKRRGWGDAFLSISDGFAAWAFAAAGARKEAEEIARALLRGPEPFRWAAGIPLILLGRFDEGFSVLPDTPQPDVGFLLGFFHEWDGTRNESRCAGLLRQLNAEKEYEMFKRVRRGENIE